MGPDQKKTTDRKSSGLPAIYLWFYLDIGDFSPPVIVVGYFYDHNCVTGMYLKKLN